MTDLISAIRPRQWTKNLLVFAGLIFAARFTDGDAVLTVVWTFIAFCLVSSAGYIFNDILDRDADAKHPEKKDRAIAAGRLPASAAGLTAAILLMAGFAISLSIRYAAVMLALYVANQVFYMLAARRVAILDVFVISFGFLIRAIAGAVVIGVFISPWLLLCTLLLALFLGFAKRKHEFDLGTESRQALGGYSLKLLDQLIGISAAAAVLSYSVYAIQSDTAQAHPMLAFTIPFPIFGVFRYLQIVYHESGGGNPDRALVRDPWILGTVLAWVSLSLYAMSTTGWPL